MAVSVIRGASQSPTPSKVDHKGYFHIMNNEFKSSDSANIVVYTALIVFWFALPILTFWFLGNMLLLMSGKGDGADLISLFAAALALYGVAATTLQMINQYSHIRVEKEGLYVRVYKFRYAWILVEWKDVLDIRISPRLDRWRKSQWIISVRELTYWHQLLSSNLQCGPEPGIIISSDIIDGEKLLKIVEKRIKK